MLSTLLSSVYVIVCLLLLVVVLLQQGKGGDIAERFRGQRQPGGVRRTGRSNCVHSRNNGPGHLVHGGRDGACDHRSTRPELCGERP